MNLKQVCFITFLGLSLLPYTHGAQVDVIESMPRTNALLIFLDDSEKSIHAVSGELLAALDNENGPIVASASLLELLHASKLQADISNEELVKLYKDQNYQKQKNITADDIRLRAGAFTQEKAAKWIIKEINNSLYLLFPKKYLQENNINIDTITAFNAQGQITQTEQQLGLKVNHMKTVAISDIKKPLPEPKFADYFIPALPNLFATNAEYPKESKNLIPAWAFYLIGHGIINSRIAALNLSQFKQFLTFLETKIKTKVFVYRSCYAAGTNMQTIYKDMETGIAKTYPFTVIIMALTDAVAHAFNFIMLSPDSLNQEKLNTYHTNNYTNFLKKITSPDITKYDEAIKSIQTTAASVTAQNIPQIKYPNLPWFSIVDSENKVVTIDSVMAKTRTTPLNIATYFAKQGKPANPDAILLAASQIPFEIVFNDLYSTKFVSMIPGDAFHYIKKISSNSLVPNDLLNNIEINDIYPRKIYYIGEITNAFPSPMNSYRNSFGNNPPKYIKHVIIEKKEQTSNAYFLANDELYSGTNNAKKATDAERMQYETLFQRYAPEEYKQYRDAKTSPTTHTITELQNKVNTTFASKIPTAEVEKKIGDLLNDMPSNSIITIKQIKGDEPFYDALENLSRYKSTSRKIISINTLERCRPQITSTDYYCKPQFHNIIIDADNNGTTIYAREFEDAKLKYSEGKELGIEFAYYPTYQKLIEHYNKHNTLDEAIKKEIEAMHKQPTEKIKDIDKRRTQEHLTPEAIANIRAAQEKKIAEQKQRALQPEKLDPTVNEQLMQLHNNLIALAQVR